MTQIRIENYCHENGGQRYCWHCDIGISFPGKTAAGSVVYKAVFPALTLTFTGQVIASVVCMLLVCQCLNTAAATNWDADQQAVQNCWCCEVFQCQSQVNDAFTESTDEILGITCATETFKTDFFRRYICAKRIVNQSALRGSHAHSLFNHRTWPSKLHSEI